MNQFPIKFSTLSNVVEGDDLEIVTLHFEQGWESWTLRDESNEFLANGEYERTEDGGQIFVTSHVGGIDSDKVRRCVECFFMLGER